MSNGLADSFDHHHIQKEFIGLLDFLDGISHQRTDLS